MLWMDEIRSHHFETQGMVGMIYREFAISGFLRWRERICVHPLEDFLGGPAQTELFCFPAVGLHVSWVNSLGIWSPNRPTGKMKKNMAHMENPKQTTG